MHRRLCKESKDIKNIQAAYNEVDLFISNVKKQNANHDLIQPAQSVFRLCASLSLQLGLQLLFLCFDDKRYPK
jgi:hypothetical protein